MTPTFKQLKKNLKKDLAGFRKIKLAILGDSATQFLNQAIRGYGVEKGLNIEVFEADYDQIERQILDPGSELYEFQPEFVLISYNSNKLFKKFAKSNIEERPGFAKKKLDEFYNLINTLNSRINTKVLFFNFSEYDDGVFGNYANKTKYSFVYQIRKLNYDLMKLSSDIKNVFIVDVNLLQSRYGNKFIIDNKIYINTDLLWTLDFLPVLAKNIIDIINSIIGVFKKCLILDLDNTLWGGIIGDDGVEKIQIGDLGIGKAFTELQLWIKQLKDRGIILAVCCKNDEAVAKEPFEKHPEMELRLSDIAVFVANWENKADNIRYIQKILNIGFDSMVFLDDNPFERNMVRENVPDVTVPELPEDPAEYLNYLKELNLFETASFSQEDSKRTKKYQEEAKRVVLQEQFTNEAEFLGSLNMTSKIEEFNSFNTPRVSQLTQRSNQFNLRTIRYTEEEIKRLWDNDQYATFAFDLEDKFGNYGIISLIILERKDQDAYFIDTWIMSCRVLKRTMENFVMNTLVGRAKKEGVKKLIGEYIPTKKNKMVENHYLDLGFEKKRDGLFELEVNQYKERETYIKKR